MKTTTIVSDLVSESSRILFENWLVVIVVIVMYHESSVCVAQVFTLERRKLK